MDDTAQQQAQVAAESLDDGGRQLAGSVLAAAGRGDRAAITELTAALDVEQLRSLVTVLAVQVDQTLPSDAVSGPAAVCDLAINAAAPLFGVTPEAVLSSQRSRPVSDARAVAMTAARANGLSLPAIAEHFGKDYGSVIHAVRRTEQRPRLADAAARVSSHVNDRYTERLPRPSHAAPGQDQAPGSNFEPHGLVEHAVVAAAEAFGTTPETLLGADRTPATSDARGVAMAAARMRGQSLPQIARHFDRDHTTVLHATRRIEKTPPLRDLAAKIAGALPKDTNEGISTPQTTALTVPSVPSTPGRSARESAGPRERVDTHASRGAHQQRRSGSPAPGPTAEDRRLQVGPMNHRLLLTGAAAMAATLGLISTLNGRPGEPDDRPLAETRTAATSTVLVSAVVDGDTLRVESRGGRDLGRVRLLGIIH